MSLAFLGGDGMGALDDEGAILQSHDIGKFPEVREMFAQPDVCTVHDQRSLCMIGNSSSFKHLWKDTEDVIHA